MWNQAGRETTPTENRVCTRRCCERGSNVCVRGEEGEEGGGGGAVEFQRYNYVRVAGTIAPAGCLPMLRRCDAMPACKQVRDQEEAGEAADDKR